MLLFSYILVAALELTLTVRAFQNGTNIYGCLFAFLFLLSALSIPLENSEMGQTVRNDFKKYGIDTAKYDLLANNARTLSYLFILKGVLDQTQGLIMAYGTSLYLVAIVMKKYIQKIKKD